MFHVADDADGNAAVVDARFTAMTGHLLSAVSWPSNHSNRALVSHFFYYHCKQMNILSN